MNIIRLLLVGDVHFPERKSPVDSADVKDTGVSNKLLSVSIPNIFGNVVREMIRLREGDPAIKGILFCGDLTSYGDLDGYRECVRYFDANLELSDTAIWPDGHVHVVPGNHDIERPLCDSPDIFSKFQAIASAWRELARPILTESKMRQTGISGTGSGIEVFSLNSCIGCGETRSLPKKVQREISDFLKNVIKEFSPEEAFRLLGEQLDTPAFLEDDMTSLVERISDLDGSHLPLILAHHNLLPQAVPRVDLYTEVINGGLVRSRLLQCERSIVYCHGHIHKDPIELIQSPQSPKSQLISVSVPPMREGFTLIEVHFARNGTPVGCLIRRHRVQDDGGVKTTPALSWRIPLAPHRTVPEVSALLKGVLHVLDTDYKRVELIVPRLKKYLKRAVPHRDLREQLLEAEWRGYLEILDRHEEFIHWQIKKHAP